MSRGAKYRLRYPRQRMLTAARRRAAVLGLPFRLSVDDIKIPEYCPVLSIPLRQATGRAHPGSPSLDRIVPALGYVPSNVRVISYRANMIKRDATVFELQSILEYMETNNG